MHPNVIYAYVYVYAAFAPFSLSLAQPMRTCACVRGVYSACYTNVHCNNIFLFLFINARNLQVYTCNHMLEDIYVPVLYYY